MIPSYDLLPEDVKKDLYIKGSYDYIRVPKRFSEKVIHHVVSNYTTVQSICKPPLFLAIQGVPGEGKTTQAIAACAQRGIGVKYISSSELSGELEAASMKKLQKVYSITQKMRELGFIVCILLDDFHLGNSDNSSNNTRTVNADLLIAYMMNLADGDEKERVPIIMTGNDFSGTYNALLRDGRADIYHWAPSIDEKIQIVSRLLNSTGGSLSNEEIERFVSDYPNQNVAFFTQLVNDINCEKIDRIYDKYNDINCETIVQIQNEINRLSNKIEKEMLYRKAEERIRSRREGGLNG